ncbi:MULTISPECIES: DUF6086 family protein [Streptomyces]|uniref:Uncharacterized protein n=1 Tax=Streptomyces turgidiscabies (strain Car8) TaxID=698760 RepID=L7ETU7_STRT8|nr:MULTISPECIES: DUF6086 family protein [Streptomyces]ELP62106.1 hypothetical protein STRTUCAR8_06158 [Streptomyces turgidiscabies Car8]MDX3493007.1 DUF6086 family protein [Streptomyces turgidiscabies]GAQ74380.1 hypothetical protein T45_06155 [Streptomyces turgidiscabies]
MSYPFEHGTETLWDAGYHSGKLYASLAQGTAEFLELPSGLTPNAQGGCDVDPIAFQAFVEGLYRSYSATRNELLHGLVHGLLLTSLVLLDRAGGSIGLRPEHQDAFVSEKAALARSMGTL